MLQHLLMIFEAQDINEVTEWSLLASSLLFLFLFRPFLVNFLALYQPFDALFFFNLQFFLGSFFILY